jgi:hypothetical protein
MTVAALMWAAETGTAEVLMLERRSLVFREIDGEFRVPGKRGGQIGREDHFRWQLESWTQGGPHVDALTIAAGSGR